MDKQTIKITIINALCQNKIKKNGDDFKFTYKEIISYTQEFCNNQNHNKKIKRPTKIDEADIMGILKDPQTFNMSVKMQDNKNRNFYLIEPENNTKLTHITASKLNNIDHYYITVDKKGKAERQETNNNSFLIFASLIHSTANKNDNYKWLKISEISKNTSLSNKIVKNKLQDIFADIDNYYDNYSDNANDILKKFNLLKDYNNRKKSIAQALTNKIKKYNTNFKNNALLHQYIDLNWELQTKNITDFGLILYHFQIFSELDNITDININKLANLCKITTSELETIFADYQETAKISKLYSAKHAISIGEAQLLSDAVEVYSYITAEETHNLIEKLQMLMPKELHKTYYTETEKSIKIKTDIPFLQKLEIIRQAICNHQKLNIKYGKYNADKKLVPKECDDFQLFTPFELMWANGYYYLIALSENNSTRHLRVDRIINLQTSTENFKPKDYNFFQNKSFYETDSFSPAKYRTKYPVMYTGEIEAITLQIKTSLINALLDTFGLDCHLKTLDSGLIEASFKSATGGVVLFATQYCTECKIIKPLHAQAEVVKRLEQGLEFNN